MKKILSYLLLIAAILTGSVPLAVGTPKKGSVKVACVGNSITYGYKLADREHDAYPAQLQRMLGESYTVGNFGHSGATLLRRGHNPYTELPEYREALDFAGDIVVIHLGINDTDPRDWPNYRDEFVRDYLDLIASFRKINPQTRCIVARMTPITDRHPRFLSGTQLWHEEIQRAIEIVARVSGAELIDFHTPLYDRPTLLHDAVHPDAEGASIMARVVYSAVTGDYGGLRLPMPYTDNMVLQRGIPLRIHGTADAGTPVCVRIAGQQKHTRADYTGRWQVTLEPLTAGEGYTLSVETPTQKKTFENVAAGEVWLCSGQSNMQFMLKQAEHAESEIRSAADSGLRFFDMKGRWATDDIEWTVSATDSVDRLLYYKKTVWAPCTPGNAAEFSAAAYYFGCMLRDSLQVPVGLICNAVGGSPAAAWVDRHSLETKFPAILKDWLHNDFIQPWARERGALNLRQSTAALKRHPYEPCYLFEAGILPLEKYPVKGVIWYQGESNADNFEAHEKLFELLVNGWRANWENAQMPFYFVQLSSLSRPSWTWFRDSQRRLAERLPYTGMAVCSDRGDSLDVHPRAKKEVGQRLARWALNRDYGFKITPSGPLFKSATVRGKAVTVEFDYAQGLGTSDGKAPSCFEIAAEEGLYYPAQATLEGSKVRLESYKVAAPRFVRYAWQPFTRANLVNGDGLPASTFRAEIERKRP